MRQQVFYTVTLYTAYIDLVVVESCSTGHAFVSLCCVSFEKLFLSVFQTVPLLISESFFILLLSIASTEY